MNTEPEHDPDASRVIAAELAACLLGARERTELRMDSTGHIARIGLAFGFMTADLGAKLRPALARATEAIRAMTTHASPAATRPDTPTNGA